MKRLKVILLIFVFICILILFPNLVMADTVVKTDDLYGRIDPDNYEPNSLQEEDVEGLESFGGRIAGVVQVIGTIVSVGTIMIIGIRYVLASADEKAEYRDRMIPYFIGAVLLFGASNIVNIIYKIFH